MELFSRSMEEVGFAEAKVDRRVEEAVREDRAKEIDTEELFYEYLATDPCGARGSTVRLLAQRKDIGLWLAEDVRTSLKGRIAVWCAAVEWEGRGPEGNKARLAGLISTGQRYADRCVELLVRGEVKEEIDEDDNEGSEHEEMMDEGDRKKETDSPSK